MVLPAGPSAAIVVERLFLRGWQVEKGQRGMAVGTDAMVVVVVVVFLSVWRLLVRAGDHLVRVSVG